MSLSCHPTHILVLFVIRKKMEAIIRFINRGLTNIRWSFLMQPSTWILKEDRAGQPDGSVGKSYSHTNLTI